MLGRSFVRRRKGSYRTEGQPADQGAPGTPIRCSKGLRDGERGSPPRTPEDRLMGTPPLGLLGRLEKTTR